MFGRVGQGETIMSFQISGFVQFFQDLFETAPTQPLAVPQRGATLEGIRNFVASLRLPADLRNQLVDAHLKGFADHFRVRGVDPNDEGACTRFTKEFLNYFSWKPSAEFLNARNAQGMTPLMCALKEEDLEFVMDLRQHGAVVDSELLTFAIRNDAPDKFIEYLFKHAEFPYFEDWNHPDASDLLRRHRLKWSDLLDNIRLLAERSRPLAVKCLKRSALRETSLVHDAASRGDAALIPILKDAGFDLDEWLPDWRTGITPLMTAIMRRPANRTVVRALLAAGATADIKNWMDESPLTCAHHYGHKAIALLLIRHGAPATPEIENWISKDEDQQN
jgi:ankyrin repeat protein